MDPKMCRGSGGQCGIDPVSAVVIRIRRPRARAKAEIRPTGLRQSVRSDRLIAISAPMGPVKVSPVGTNPARR